MLVRRRAQFNADTNDLRFYLILVTSKRTKARFMSNTNMHIKVKVNVELCMYLSYSNIFLKLPIVLLFVKKHLDRQKSYKGTSESGILCMALQYT